MLPTASHIIRQKGFTRIELFVVVSSIVILFLVTAPMLSKRYMKAARIKCSSNLKQIALAFKMYAGDNNGKFPWIPKSSDTELTHRLQVWEYFQTISNELGSTKILLCPQEEETHQRQPAYEFSDSLGGLAHPGNQNHAVSYFLGIYSSESLTNSILAGDRTLTTPNSRRLYRSNGTTAVEVTTNSIWSSAPMEANHEGYGVVALADGSVQQGSSARLQEALRLARDSSGTNANRFLFPQ
jgi:Tfp pilus assembly protein PilE